ncbi:MAG TPA: DNA alkylation repair protein [Candidatus Saccharimonadales bacterium]|nr:DNA alkylation repair protein [Candidatus Saccharimonadales bacterium]
MSSMGAAAVVSELAKHATSPQDTAFLARFFKTGKGQYGEGDVFIGVRVPQIRVICKQFALLPLAEVQTLFNSPIHEHRLAAAIILTYQYPKTSNKKAVFDFYVANVRSGRINNWDIVDVTAPSVMGRYLWDTDSPRDILFTLANSDNLWHKRTSLLASYYFFSKGGNDYSTTIDLCKKLLYDPHDLIQKAVGWMLREIGKRCGRDVLLTFLHEYATTMPRTALRYAIEHLPPNQRADFMAKKQRRLQK